MRDHIARPCLPTRAMATPLLSCPGHGTTMWQDPPGGKQCPHILDPYGRHAACCTKSLHTRRHDCIRDLLTKLEKQAGLTAATEQTIRIPDQIMPDGQPAPGSVRPIHRADVHIIERPQGSELWLDVKIHTRGPELSVAKELLSEEQTKYRAYGQREGYNLQALDKGMTPVVLECSTIWQNRPRGASHLQQDHPSLPPAPCPTGNALLTCQAGRQLRAVGPHLLHAAPSSMAGPHGVHTKNSARPILETLHQACLTLPGRRSE